MNDEELRQRLKYLVEHGGIWDDPIGDLRRHVRWLYALFAASLVLNTIDTIALLG